MTLNFKQLHNPKLSALFKKQGVVLAYLFGSQATGRAHKESDVDIAVLFGKNMTKKQYFNQTASLSLELSQYFNGRETQVIALNEAPPLLRQVVVNEGKEIYCSDENQKIEFIVQTLYDYEDYLHLSKIYYQLQKQKI